MIYKVCLLFIVFFVSGITYSCFEQCQDYKYYDYKGISIEIQNNAVETTDSLYFQIHFEESYYLATKYRFCFFNSANATIDCDQGWGGDKYPLVRISIKSDSEFNTDFPAISELNSIVKVYGNDSNNQYVLDNIDQFNVDQINPGHFYILMRPKTDKSHRLTVEMEKSNGDVVSAVSNQIKWM